NTRHQGAGPSCAMARSPRCVRCRSRHRSATRSCPSRALLVPAIDTDDVQGGELRAPTRYAIRTDPNVTPPACVLRHLERTASLLSPRARRVPHWLPAESWHRLDLTEEVL